MKEFINSLGYTNFLIIILVIVVIFALLIVVLFLEKKSRKEKINIAINNLEAAKKDNRVLDEDSRISKKIGIKDKKKIDKSEIVEKKPITINKENTPIAIIDIPKIIKESTEEKQPLPVEMPKIKNEDLFIIKATTSDKKEPEVQEKIKYDEHVETKKEAQEKLREVTKKLVTEKKEDIEGPTYFEQEQEESSIISYEELKKISQNVDKTNDILLDDEGNEPITIEELYKKHVEQQDKENIDDTKNIANPEFDEKTFWEPKNFHNSELISPVFGIWKNEIKQSENYTKEDFDKTIELEELEVEIKKTEEFLRELKDLKNKLD